MKKSELIEQLNNVPGDPIIEVPTSSWMEQTQVVSVVIKMPEGKILIY